MIIFIDYYNSMSLEINMISNVTEVLTHKFIPLTLNDTFLTQAELLLEI